MTSQQINLSSILEIDPLRRIRRNHGLEHATLHVLAERYPHTPFAGHSDASGFWIIGDLPTESLAEVVNEAVRRLQNGQRRLAVHPNCGTNFVTAGSLAGIGAAFAMFGAGRRLRDLLERLPLAILLATLGIILAQPLGLSLQERITTSPEAGALKSVQVVQANQGRFKAHRVLNNWQA